MALFYTILLAACTLKARAFDNSRFDNTAVYYGQNSYGAGHSDVANFQKTLSFYCNDNAIDVFPIAFVNVFFGPGGAPSLNLANTCNPTDNATFPGTTLPNCSRLASDITTCQSKGKLVTLSLGGATGSVGFASDAQGSAFAQTIWNLFLGGSSSTRPFGTAVLDGVDLDIEGGGGVGYAAFVNTIRSLSNGASKKYYITAAPQCVYPDGALGSVLNAVSFDAVYVQVWHSSSQAIITIDAKKPKFYNNPCSLPNFASASAWNFGIWDVWARSISPNRNVKIYIGAPGAPSAAGSGYVGPDTLASIAVQMRRSFPSFGGVMLWDASQAYVNGRFDLAIKNALVAAGGTGFTFPACSAPAYSTTGTYVGGSKVSFQGYIWQAKWFASGAPAGNPNGDWSPISACSGGGTTTTVNPPGPTSGSCSGVPEWTSTAIFVGGQQAVHNSHLWTAQWYEFQIFGYVADTRSRWTQGDTPGGSVGVWVDKGACPAAKAARPISRVFRS